MHARPLAVAAVLWVLAEAALFWLSHENHLRLGSLAPGLGLLVGAALLGMRTRRRPGLASLAAALLALAVWAGVSRVVFEHRDRTLVAAWRTALQQAPHAPVRARPNVLVVLSDTLRRDHLTLHGYPRETSPQLAAFAAEAAVFEHAFAQAPSTKPSVASLFTSTFPSQHRAIANEDALDDSLVTVAEVLQRAGYRTAAFVENPIIGREFGYHRGFDHWAMDGGRHSRRGSSIDSRMNDLDGALEIWLRANRHQNFFLYVHYIDPHSPYRAPRPYRGRFDPGDATVDRELHVGDAPWGDQEVARARYDEEILYVDGRFGRLVDWLRGLGLLDSTAVIFLSDHGEGFGEHGYAHHSRSVYSDLIDVPLLIRYPARFESARIDRLVQHVDVAPTILDLARIDASGFDFQGHSLLAPPADAPAVVVEHLRVGWGTPQRAVIQGRHKLVHDIESDRFRLYDIEADPGDRRDLLASAEPGVVAQLKDVLARHTKREGLAGAPRVELSETTRRSLEALGYVR